MSAPLLRVHSQLPSGQWAAMSERQRAAWRNFCALSELSRRLRANPSYLALPPRERQAEATQPRS
jgi:hypothetical protein